MKKTIKIVAILIIMLIALSGCVSMDYGIKVNRNGSADVDYTIQYGVEELDEIGISTSTILTSLESETAKLSKDGYTTEIISNDEKVGYKVTKHYDNASDVSIANTIGKQYIEGEKENSIKVTKGIFVNKYSLDTKIDLSSMTFTDEETSAYMGKTVAELFDIKVRAKVPGIKSSNSTNKEKGYLVWNLTPGEVNEVKFETTVLTPLSIGLITVVGVAIVAGIAIVIIKKSKSNKTVVEDKKEFKKENAKETVKKVIKKEEKDVKTKVKSEETKKETENKDSSEK